MLQRQFKKIKNLNNFLTSNETNLVWYRVATARPEINMPNSRRHKDSKTHHPLKMHHYRNKIINPFTQFMYPSPGFTKIVKDFECNLYGINSSNLGGNTGTHLKQSQGFPCDLIFIIKGGIAFSHFKKTL